MNSISCGFYKQANTYGGSSYSIGQGSSRGYQSDSENGSSSNRTAKMLAG